MQNTNWDEFENNTAIYVVVGVVLAAVVSILVPVAMVALSRL